MKTDQNTSTPQRIELHAYEVTIPSADGESVAAKIPLMVPMEWDESIQEWLLTPEAMDEIETTKARHMGLLTPAELLELRERLCLTQAEIADLVKIGAKTWTRWETGKQRPSQSLNLILRALQTGSLTVPALRQLGQPQVDWTAALVPVPPTEPFTPSLPWPEGIDQQHDACYEEMPLAA